MIKRILTKTGSAGTMPNKEYWSARAVERVEHFEDVAQEGVQEIIDKYKQVQAQLSDNFESWYEKHGVKDGRDVKLIFNEVFKPLDMKDASKVKNKAKAALKNAAPEAKEYIKALKQIAGSMRLPKNSEINLDAQILTYDLSVLQNLKIEKLLKSSLQSSFIMTIDDLTSVLAADKGELTKKWITEAVYKPWYGENFSDRIWDNRDMLVDKLQQGLLRNIAAGEKAQSITAWIGKQFSTSASNAERLVRTEMKNVVEQGTLAAYAEAAVKKYEYVAILDNNTSDICKTLDNKVFLVKDAQVGVNYPPMHPNCRSTTIAVF